MQCLERYGADPVGFLDVFKPGRQALFCRRENLERVYMGEAPTLAAVAQAYGPDTAELWMATQIRDLSEFAGVKEKLTAGQYDQLAAMIRAEYGYMKVTELMHFCWLFKSGRYGEFYGAVDPMTILQGLRRYRAERLDTIAKLERDANREEEQQRDRIVREAAAMFRDYLAGLGLTHLEWCRLKEQGKTDEEIEQEARERARADDNTPGTPATHLPPKE